MQDLVRRLLAQWLSASSTEKSAAEIEVMTAVFLRDIDVAGIPEDAIEYCFDRARLANRKPTSFGITHAWRNYKDAYLASKKPIALSRKPRAYELHNVTEDQWDYAASCALTRLGCSWHNSTMDPKRVAAIQALFDQHGIPEAPTHLETRFVQWLAKELHTQRPLQEWSQIQHRAGKALVAA